MKVNQQSYQSYRLQVSINDPLSCWILYIIIHVETLLRTKPSITDTTNTQVLFMYYYNTIIQTTRHITQVVDETGYSRQPSILFYKSCFCHVSFFSHLCQHRELLDLVRTQCLVLFNLSHLLSNHVMVLGEALTLHDLGVRP